MSTNFANVIQVREIILHQLHLIWSQPQLVDKVAPIMLWGAPGVGKSSIIKDLCTQLNIGFIDIRLSQRDPVDLRGLPVPDLQNKQVNWMLSAEWPRDENSQGIILFDEITAADRSLQVAAYELILDRCLGEMYKVPKGWLICAAGNRIEDRAVAMTISSALANRFCHLELEPDLNQWAKWASLHNLHSDVIAFLRFKPNYFFDMSGNVERGWPSPRSWERVALMLDHGAEMSKASLVLMMQGLVGRAATLEFFTFKNLIQVIPDVEKLLLGELDFKVPERADMRYAITSSMAYHLWRGDATQRHTRVSNFLKISLQLSSDFAVMAMTDAMQKIEDINSIENQLNAEILFSHPLYEVWVKKHGEGLYSTQLKHDKNPKKTSLGSFKDLAQ